MNAIYQYLLNSTNSPPPAVSAYSLAAPNLYDGAVGDTSTGYNISSGNMIWALADLGASPALAVTKYEFATTGSPGGGAYLWGSNDGTTWTQLSGPNYQGTTTFSNPTAYRYYALGQSGSTVTNLKDFRLYDSGGTIVTGGAGTPDFSMTPGTQGVVFSNGTPKTITPDVTITALNGFSGTVALALTGVPSGLTASMSSANVAAGGTSNLVLSGSAVAPGIYTITLTGTSGALTHTQTITLAVPAQATKGGATPSLVALTSAQMTALGITPQAGGAGGTQAWIDGPTGTLLAGPTNYTSGSPATMPDGAILTPTNGTPPSMSVSVPAGASIAAGSGYVAGMGNGAGATTYFLFDVLPVVASVPAAPTGLSATPGTGSIALAWAANGAGDNVTAYKVYRYTLGNSPVYVGTNSTPTYTDLTVANNVVYYYQVTAVNATGEGPLSSAATATIVTGGFIMERGSVFQGVQIGPEVTPGTTVAATKRLLALQADAMPNIPVRTFKPMGQKSTTATQQGKEWTECRFTGIADFNMLGYLLASLLGPAPTPTTLTGGAYQYLFTSHAVAPDTPQTFTVEIGSSLGASKFSYGTVTDMTLRFTREEASCDGTILGQALIDNITMTPSVPDLPAVAVPPKLVRISLGTTSSSLTTLHKVISAEIRLNGHWKPAFFIDDGFSSFSGLVEAVPDFGGQVVVELGSESDTFLAGLRGDILYYIQVFVNGAQISAGPPAVYYNMTLTMPVKVSRTTREDHDGVYGGTYDLASAYDNVFGLVQVSLINKLATLS